jgi:2-(1,2-epoxy-1,2-dihydrophenyl)acetyl-CoA isomerase
MIYKVVSDEQFDEVVHSTAQNLAAMPTKGLGLTKRALNKSFESSLEQQLEWEAVIQTEAGQTYDFNEGVQAFLEKRKPEFKGK